jgi:hypothetical protein
MTIRKRVSGLEKAVDLPGPSALPRTEKIQVLKPGETVEQRKAAVIGKYGSARGIIFARIKGRD